MTYRIEAVTLEGFVQQLAVAYVRCGYWFYVQGELPPKKDPAKIDVKFLARYPIDISKWARLRRKRAGCSNHHYIRFGRYFVLLASHGLGDFFEEEANVFRDCRKTPIRIGGYAISFRGGHVQVRIEDDRYRELKSAFLELAPHRSVDELAREFRGAFRFEPYSPIRSQMLCVLRAVNRARSEAGLEPVPKSVFRFRRRILRPFDPMAVQETPPMGVAQNSPPHIP